ncbi:Cuticle protein 16.8 like protein [Argiope bruennichi]|uniref:Cuticle protein 16.8 like protein n=1 Tax=Argiope bruennichi TaxID=94029 RepID=A0A8T0EYI8_ARGBR|nr:Cuticle protein 16.8 like protein [Argiope bruennichi]
MLAKVFVSLLLVSTVVSYPIAGAEDEDDLPVYTEKVSSAKPTTRIPRFESKKLSPVPKKASESISPAKEPSYSLPEQPKVVAPKPIRSNPRPVRRTPDHPQNAIAEGAYPKPKPSLRVGYNAPKPSYVPAPAAAPAPVLGVEYAPEVADNSYEASPLHVEEPRPKLVRSSAPEYGAPSVHAEEPRPKLVRPSVQEYRASPLHVEEPRPKLVRSSVSEYGAAAGNAPHLRYEVAPQALAAPSTGYKADYNEDKPQPYIFGYEFQDEKGATQSRKEEGDDYGNKRGSYGYRDEHGIYRQVEYIADSHGFRAVVKTNEPGTDNQNPADVQMHSEAAKY